jgi:Predicted membrane protein (DUF2306)
MTDVESAPARTAPVVRAKPRWWRRPWIVPFWVVVLAFLVFSVPPYAALDPTRSRVPPPDGFEPHYAFLVAHVLFGTVALLATCVQVWPWFRQRYPVAHRRIGRVYVFGGVLPAGVSGFVLGATSSYGLAGQASTMLLSTLWVGFTVMGLRMARQRRYADHRRWMLRSFALTASIITNRVWGIVLITLQQPQLETTYDGDMQRLIEATGGVTAWLGWTVLLLIAEWWIVERGRGRARRIRPRPDSVAGSAAG